MEDGTRDWSLEQINAISRTIGEIQMKIIVFANHR